MPEVMLDLYDEEKEEYDNPQEIVENKFIQDEVAKTLENRHTIEEEESEIDENGNIVYKNEKEDEESNEEEDDIITSILKSRHIDPSAVKIENEDGEIEEVDFYSLSLDEQKDILFPEDDVASKYDLDDQEINLINQIRQYGVTPSEFLQIYGASVLNNSQQPQEVSVSIDHLEDDEIFIADLKSKLEDITDEEAVQALELEKSNPELYAKKVNALRSHYRQMELDEQERLAKEAEAEEMKAYKEFESQIVNTIEDMSKGIDLGTESLAWDLNDKEDIAAFILDSDKTGTRYLAKALQDPKTLVQMSWFALKGQEAISSISSYYKAKITEAAKTNYQKGYDDAKNGNKKSEVKSMVRKPAQKANAKVDKEEEELWHLYD